MKKSNSNIDHLEPNEIFVFGSNLSGIHGAGAAKLAKDRFGAEYGNPIGLQGQSYALPTKDGHLRTLPLDIIQWYVSEFIEFAKSKTYLEFLVTEVGCGLAGYTPNDIAPLFSGALEVENISLPKSFVEFLTE